MKKDKKGEENKIMENEEIKNEVENKDGKDEQIAELTADVQRIRADFENYRKQMEMQKENERKMVKLATVYKLLPLLDDFERAFLAYKELEPLEKSLEKTLGELGVRKMDTKNGTEFNPDLHEAIEASGEGAKETISETLRTGYFYEAEVLRPAMVKVERA